MANAHLRLDGINFPQNARLRLVQHPLYQRIIAIHISHLERQPLRPCRFNQPGEAGNARGTGLIQMNRLSPVGESLRDGRGQFFVGFHGNGLQILHRQQLLHGVMGRMGVGRLLQGAHPLRVAFRHTHHLEILRQPQQAAEGYGGVIVWLLLFDYGGVVNRVLSGLGLGRVLWLESEALRFPVVLLYIWKNVGFSVVIFSAALQAVPEPLYEFAALEGANAFQREVKITLPLILPTAFLVFVLAWVNAFKIFKEVYFIGGAYPRDAVYTLQHFMNNKFAKLDYQDVTTAAYSFAVIVLALFGVLYMSKSVRSNDV